ncbi:hypothetical protein POSPLADRAFT_1058477 [Postia placenta MAD-698-R-SB12]|uniref:F-box domain-containing protein n=1 Tax=Postia placenta MAD-698-R-SB12 TaxID=670580 RepID=A0A1X6MVP6_9APHY|nr:hypothetical protein POSPLADRAFT_1058477 [Postia placenta MAD-698-R-SB12]OSX60302.1 hypothetical protein POSPLADRAFT_1058477 [Postia placenta MAD-698-R-SB12]
MTSVVYNTMPTPSHYDSQYTAPIPVAITDETESTVVHGRLQHNGVVSVSGANVIPFCQTVVLPGLQRVAHQIRKLSIDFGSERPTHSNLEHLSAALEALPNCTNLTLLGLPSVEYDGWVLRNTTFSLTRLVTNLSLTSKDVIDFLRRQPALAELSTTSPPPHLVQPRSTYAHFPFPHEVVPNLHTLDCPAPFLFSLQVATPPTRPLMNMRLDLNRLNSLVEIEALTALATYSATVERLSLRRSVLRTSPALDSVVALNMASVISRVANKRQWSKLKFLEMRDGMYDSYSIPKLAQAISSCFPNVETLVWAPASHPAGSTIVVPFIASIFFTFCRSLKQFIFLDDASDVTNKKFVSIAKTSSGLCEVLVKAPEVENMWREESV